MYKFDWQTETRKAELETNLTTNLKRRKQELEAIVSAAEADALLDEVDLKRQELMDAKLLVEGATQQLKSKYYEYLPQYLVKEWRSNVHCSRWFCS